MLTLAKGITYTNTVQINSICLDGLAVNAMPKASDRRRADERQTLPIAMFAFANNNGTTLTK
jgi:hypothetical protein